MALLRTKELREMRPEDVRAKFKELSDELMHERGIAAMGGAPASPGKIRALRTNIARIHTVMREQELAKEKAPAKAPASKPEERKKEAKAAPRPKRKKSERSGPAAAGPADQNEEEKK